MYGLFVCSKVCSLFEANDATNLLKKVDTGNENETKLPW
jgi:hypothetical protein